MYEVGEKAESALAEYVKAAHGEGMIEILPDV